MQIVAACCYSSAQDNRRQICTILCKERLQMATVANKILSAPKMSITMLTHYNR